MCTERRKKEKKGLADKSDDNMQQLQAATSTENKLCAAAKRKYHLEERDRNDRDQNSL